MMILRYNVILKSFRAISETRGIGASRYATPTTWSHFVLTFNGISEIQVFQTKFLLCSIAQSTETLGVYLRLGDDWRRRGLDRLLDVATVA